ncbi:MarR family transcriptional regulator [Nocardioides sp. GY 10127]|uniref:MarR family winged helix-turn-helix transcriptional regulator n=1 Tax=Nocardioides sp. GY 10127 TaxID=2569762 RepID=UPI0010A78380|nr:MarR family transcriptional regulator [Nocardioides sp. GY 10127]TIC86408.1 MarR family transcriptional regulator [Nocardioides sp. GY 10127]
MTSPTPGQEPVPMMEDVADALTSVARVLLGAHFPRDAVRLTPNEVAVLRHVHRHPGATSGETAAATGLQRSNLSTTLRSLEASGLVERRHGDDARTVCLHVTAAAEASMQSVRQGWGRALEDALARNGGPVSASALETLLAVVVRMEEGLAAAL